MGKTRKTRNLTLQTGNRRRQERIRRRQMGVQIHITDMLTVVKKPHTKQFMTPVWNLWNLFVWTVFNDTMTIKMLITFYFNHR